MWYVIFKYIGDKFYDLENSKFYSPTSFEYEISKGTNQGKKLILYFTRSDLIMAKTKGNSENTIKIVNYMKGIGVGAKQSGKEIAEALGFEKVATVTGTMLSLYKKGVVGKEKTENGTLYVITADGANYDPTVVPREA